MLQIHHRHKRWQPDIIQHQQHQQHQQCPGENKENSVPQFNIEHHHNISLCWVAKVPKLQLVKVVLLITLCLSLVPGGVTRRARRHQGKHLVIHVPMKIRTHHHTHTVFTQLKGVGKGVGIVGEGAHGSGGGDGKRATKQTIYKIMGYSTHHTSAGAGARGGGGGGAIAGGSAYGRGYGHGHGYAHRQGHRIVGGGIGSGGGGIGGGSGMGGSYGEINYDDYTNTNCDNSLAHGDMIFNHYSRQDEDYPDVEELIEDEDDREHDEWE